MKRNQLVRKLRKKSQYFWGLATGFLLAVLVLKLLPLITVKANTLILKNPLIANYFISPTPDVKKEIDTITKTVLPSQMDLGVTFGETIVKMVEVGAIDKNKFIQLYQSREELAENEKKLLDAPSNEKIIINEKNANLILNLLWPLGLANKTDVLDKGPMGTEYKNDVGNFASTGGWTLGKQDGGKLFNQFTILPLTPQQEELVKELAQNIYRPCCGNSTYFPDCNHGAAMLGFLELAVTQGLPKAEIYKKALALNSYWFPQTYADLAVFFKMKKNIPWDKVDAKLALSQDYSSGQGYRTINKQLQDENLLPKVEGGGGCGV